MFIPLGFTQESILTSKGRIVYYTTSDDKLWKKDDSDRSLTTLVFLHGFFMGSSAYEWSLVYPAFAPDYNIVAADLLGWGRSEHLERHYQIEDYLDSITEFIQQIALDKKITLIATSLSAAIGIRIAIAHPELFQNLILVAPSGLADFGENKGGNFLVDLLNLPFINQLFYKNLMAHPDNIKLILEDNLFANPDLVSQQTLNAYIESAQQPNSFYTVYDLMGNKLSFDLSLYLNQLTIPTSIIWGEKANLTNLELGKRLAKLNPGTIKIFESLPEVGLLPQLETPSVVIGLIKKMISELCHI